MRLALFVLSRESVASKPAGDTALGVLDIAAAVVSNTSPIASWVPPILIETPIVVDRRSSKSTGALSPGYSSVWWLLSDETISKWKVRYPIRNPLR
jgi:hypothetical protein